MGRLEVRVVDEARTRDRGARLSHRSDGKPWTPAGAYERLASLNRHLFHTSGRYVTEAPPGTFRIEATKGFEYAVARQEVEIRAGQTTTVTVALQRLVDLRGKGWYSGSNHVHLNYAGNLHNTPENMMLMAGAEDVHMVGLQIANKDNRILDYQHYTPGQAHHPVSTAERIMHVGQEYRPPFYGHIALFNLKTHLISPFVTGYEGTGVESLYPSNTDIFRYAKQQGGIGSYVHPFGGDRDPVETNLGTAKTFPVDVALGALSYHELWSQSAGEAALNVWYRILNNGFRVPVTGGEDSISNLHRVELVGSVRGYFHLGQAPLTWDNWMKAMLAGRGFVSNGPLVEFTANQGTMPGEEIALPAAGGAVTFNATVTSLAPLTRVELVSNGEVVHGIDVPAGQSSVTFSHTAQVSRSGWYSLRAVGAGRTFPVENTRPLAVTNPIYVIAGGQPIRDRASSEYFVKWIDILTGMAEKHPGWRSERRRRTCSASSGRRATSSSGARPRRSRQHPGRVAAAGRGGDPPRRGAGRSARQRALCLPRVVDEHRLQLGEEVQAFLGHLALADAGGLGAAERQLRLAADRRLVDVHHADLDVLDEAHHGGDVLREDRRGEAVLDAVGLVQRLLERRGRGHRQHRPEDLFPEDRHRRIDVVEDRRLDEVALGQVIRTRAAGHQPGPGARPASM